MKIGDKLRIVVASKYSKIGDLADKFEMNYSQLSQYLNNRDVSVAFLAKVIKEFPEVDLNWLLRNDETIGDSVSEPPKDYKKRKNQQEIISKIEVLLGELKQDLPQK